MRIWENIHKALSPVPNAISFDGMIESQHEGFRQKKKPRRGKEAGAEKRGRKTEPLSKLRPVSAIQKSIHHSNIFLKIQPKAKKGEILSCGRFAM